MKSSFEHTLARLNLEAVLPALGQLVELSAPAAEIAHGWGFPLRLRLVGGPQATILPKDGLLAVSLEKPPSGALTLNFFSAKQLNQTFMNKRAAPPIPSGALHRLAQISKFTKLTKLLDEVLQPSEEALRDPEFLRVHLRLLFCVLIGALPVIAACDEAAHHALETTPHGLAEIRMDALDLCGWARWDGERLVSGFGVAPSAPDVRIAFTDAASSTAALRSQLDATAAVGLGQIEVRGLVPLADSLGVAMDKVEVYLKPIGS